MKIETGVLHTIEMPVGSISTEGVYQICKYVEENLMWGARDYLESVGFEWAWKTTRGTLPKRLRSTLSAKTVFIPDNFISEVGNIAATHANKIAEHYFDFTQDFNWERGDFGDNQSCFWTARLPARTIMLPELGAYAVRFFEPYVRGGYYDGYIGNSRAWLVPVSDELYVLFNTYSAGGKYNGYDIARILSHYWGVSYKRIELYNNGVCDGLLWINGDGTGYAIGAPHALPGVFDFCCPEPVYYTCCCCENVFDECDLLPSPGGELVCEHCHNSYVKICSVCEESVWDSDTFKINNTGDRVCYSCFDEGRYRCSRCDCVITRSTGMYWGFCWGCWNNHTFICSLCERTFDESQRVDHRNLCQTCAGEANV